jgi:glycosyltransferase involved in cell wall biosynthesis
VVSGPAKRAAFVVPGDLATPTGGYTYDRHIIAGLRTLGWDIAVHDIGDSFPRPSVEVRAAARRCLAALAGECPIVIDGLAFGVLAAEARALTTQCRFIALVHHPLALETGLNAAEAAVFAAGEKAALAFARHVIVTSPSTARALTADYAVAPERISVVRPGVDRAVVMQQVRQGPIDLLAVGSVVPRKGYDVLVAALGEISDLDWHMTIAGDRSRSLATAAALDAEIARLGLTERITFAGAVAPERLGTLYDAADIFVLPSRFEGYGMAYAEAIAHGVPVIGTRAGAVPDTVPEAAGVLIPPDDVGALVSVLRNLIENPAERARLAAGTRAAALAYPTWTDSAQLFAHALEQVPAREEGAPA